MDTRLLIALALASSLFGCTGGGTGGGVGGGGGSSVGGGGGSGGGSGGGTADAGVPPNKLPGEYEAFGNQVVVTPDGGVLVVGDLFKGADAGTFGDMFVARFTHATTRDPSFGTDGVASADFDGGSLGGGLISTDFDFGHGLALDGDKIVAVGAARGQNLGGYDFALMRLLPNGQRDPSFGTNGLVLRTLNSTLGVQLNNVVVLPGGKYLACGGFNGNHALERYNTDGSIDGTYTAALMDFGSDREHCGTLLMQGTKPLVGGRSFALVRYTEAGAVDATFGTNGLYTTDGTLGEALLRADGKIWMIGSVTKLVNGNDKSYLKQVLLSADGVPEASFGTNGVLEVEYSVSHVRGVAFHGSKAIAYIPSAPSRLIRLNTDGSIDSAFGTGGSIAVPFKLPLLDGVFDAHHHLAVSGNTVWVTDSDLVTVRPNVTVSRLGLFSAPLN